jgi:hypothetical protein
MRTTQGLNATPAASGSKRSAHTLPRLEGPLAIEGEHLSKARCVRPARRVWPTRGLCCGCPRPRLLHDLGVGDRLYRYCFAEALRL